MNKGDLVFWVAPNGDKHWGIVKSFEVWYSEPGYRIVSDCSITTHPASSIVDATESEVEEYNQNKWGMSPAVTRAAIAQARGLAV